MEFFRIQRDLPLIRDAGMTQAPCLMYWPDSNAAQREMIEWARRRVANGA